MNKHLLLKDLNPAQRDAVLHTEGPLLVFAGAGSGKTRVITYRFAYISNECGIPPASILTMTFTNKAADEMKQRIGALLNRNTKDLLIGTFHSLCNRILRREIERLGFQRNFVIYDEDDSCSLIRSILKELGMHEALYKGISSKITSLKASLIDPEEFLDMTNNKDNYGFEEKFARVYVRYQDELKKNNALDFDDLIMHTVNLFKKYPDVLKKYTNQFPYIMIDEFQDTNLAQYRLSSLLAGTLKNICIVGDDDQSIYRFRGAEVKNILRFEKDFPEAKVIRLEQNYRSTQSILDAAGSIITKNPLRTPKKLWTEKGRGEKIFYCVTNDEKEEAKYIARTIRELYLKGKHSYGNFAVLYRLNIQSRPLEEALREYGLPYRIIGGISFYQRKEIKDLISYLKVIANPDDSVSLKRIINCPPRGIGSTTISRIENEANKKGKGIFEVLKQLTYNNGTAIALKEKVADFINLIEGLKQYKDKDVSILIRQILEKTGYLSILTDERIENVKELILLTKGKNLQDFIDTTSLFSGADEPHNGDFVSLMTLHSAKGLEFPVVFISGIEEGLLPYFHTVKNPEELSEERRLFYVGMTRAKDLLILSMARERKLYASVQKRQPSRFLDEIPAEYYYYLEKRPKIEPVHSGDSSVRIADNTPFDIGARVKHPRWGIGVVRECYGECDDMKVMVNFSSVGIKRLSVKFANLKRV